MPQVYTVPTNNAFAALDDQSEDELILNQSSAQLSAVQKVPVSAERSSQAARVPRGPRSNNNRPDDRRPDDRRRAQELVTEDPSENVKEAVRTARRKPREEQTRQVRVSGKIYNQIVDRQTDRQSNTGRGREMKREGGGAHNWGVPGSEWDATPAVDKPAPATADEEAPAQTESPEKPTTISYADYAAEQARNREGLELKAPVKKATQLGDDVQVYTKPKPDEAPMKQASAKTQETHANKQIPVHLRYQRDNRRRDENKRSSPRTNQQQQAPAEIKLDDKSAFPTLAH